MTLCIYQLQCGLRQDAAGENTYFLHNQFLSERLTLPWLPPVLWCSSDAPRVSQGITIDLHCAVSLIDKY